MDKHIFRLTGAALIAAGLAVLLAGCVDASLSQGGDAPATVNIQDAPEAIPEVGVSITGGGANISETVGPGTDALVFDLSVGQEHEVTIDTTNFIGRKSFTLPAGGAQIDVRMQEKLFVPDPGNGRLVKIDDMSGEGWDLLDSVENHLDDPDDAEVGPDGRIYVAAGGVGLHLFSSITDDPQPLVTDLPGSAYAVAIDHEAELVYVGGPSEGASFLQRSDLDGSGVEDLSDLMDDIVYGVLRGVAVDSEGMVYVSGTEGSDYPFPIVRKIDPERNRVVWHVTLEEQLPEEEGSDQHIDVVEKRGALFVTNPSGKDGSKILRLDPATGEIVDRFGAYPRDPDNPKPGELYGPRRFVARSNSALTVIDEDSEGNYDRLVQFAPDGSDWKTYGKSGGTTDGEGHFRFYFSPN